MITTPTQGGVGYSTHNCDVRVVARGASFSKGNLVEFDMAASDANVDTHKFGREDSIFSNVITPTSTANEGGKILAVCLEDIAQNQKGKVRLCGTVEAILPGGEAVGDRLAAAGSGVAFEGPSAGDRYIARVVGATVVGAYRLIDFDGLHGFGTKVS